jgi:hypothetical protein
MKTTNANSRVVSAAGGQRGVALILVLLMLTVLSSLGFMALYTSSIERDIDRAHRFRLSARSAMEAGTHMIAQQLIKSQGYNLDSLPPSTSILGVARGNYQIHPVIGICYVLDHNCSDPFSTNNDPNWTQDLCCFRTGRVRDKETGNLFKPTTLNDIHILDVPNRKYMLDRGRRWVPPGGSSEYEYRMFDFAVSGGGPARSFSEATVMMKVGPVPGGGDLGTGYGSQTGINAS